MAKSRGRSRSPSGSGDDPRRKLRCAIYTRKSSEEGLEQSFNSLHAQRDACEAYVASQKHEGWMLLPQAYDDGGLSGGSMERPALQMLLEHIRSGLIDIVLVYKVDRLTRSLADFAKLTELFDGNGTSFVSVTHQFNTSTSMGRLTLNVPLSFAQFEREVAGERIRDKIALSKRRGMWMGGLPPLGYDGIDKQLVVNQAEAETVRLIFRRYLELGSVAALKLSLDTQGVVSKRRRFQDGKTIGGAPISRGALYQILRNRLYRGEIAHRGEVYSGDHRSIVDGGLWDSVQARLTDQSARQRGSGSAGSESALLAGLVFDRDGNRLTPTYSVKTGRRHRYYVSAPLVRGVSTPNGIRVPAPDLERLVTEAITSHLGDPLWVAEHFGGHRRISAMQRLVGAAARLGQSIRDQVSPPTDGSGQVAVTSLIDCVVVAEGNVSIQLDRSALCAILADVDDGSLPARLASDEPIEITVAAHALRCGKQVRLIIGEVDAENRSPDPALTKLIINAHNWFDDLRGGKARTIAEIAKRDRQQVSHVSRTLSLAFLAPDIVEMILTGRQPMHLTPERLKAARPLPRDWNEQRALLLG